MYLWRKDRYMPLYAFLLSLILHGPWLFSLYSISIITQHFMALLSSNKDTVLFGLVTTQMNASYLIWKDYSFKDLIQNYWSLHTNTSFRVHSSNNNNISKSFADKNGLHLSQLPLWDCDQFNCIDLYASSSHLQIRIHILLEVKTLSILCRNCYQFYLWIFVLWGKLDGLQSLCHGLGPWMMVHLLLSSLDSSYAASSRVLQQLRTFSVFHSTSPQRTQSFLGRALDGKAISGHAIRVY